MNKQAPKIRVLNYNNLVKQNNVWDEQAERLPPMFF